MRFFIFFILILSLTSSIQCDTWMDQLSDFLIASGQAACVDINANRVAEAESRSYLEDIWYGFFDGLFNCQDYNSNTEHTAPIPGTLYGDMAAFGHALERGIYQIIMLFV